MGDWCRACHRYIPDVGPPWYERAAKQLVMWVGWGAIGGGTWVVVGEIIKKFVVKA